MYDFTGWDRDRLETRESELDYYLGMMEARGESGKKYYDMASEYNAIRKEIEKRDGKA